MKHVVPFRFENVFDFLFNLAFLLIVVGGIIFIVSKKLTNRKKFRRTMLFLIISHIGQFRRMHWGSPREHVSSEILLYLLTRILPW